ncbi:MAG: OmpA family protein [Bacteroidota bacterium]
MKGLILLVATILSFAKVSSQTDDPALIKSIFFGGGSYYIDGQQINDLNEWLDGFPGLEGYDILIHSHTDNIGSLEYNQWLSQMRSQSVIRILEQRGLRPETISKEDFGELSPVYDNNTWEGKLRNRRADVILIPPNT